MKLEKKCSIVRYGVLKAVLNFLVNQEEKELIKLTNNVSSMTRVYFVFYLRQICHLTLLLLLSIIKVVPT